MLAHAERSVLVVTDIQARLAAAMPPLQLARVLRNAGILLQATGRLDIPVIVTEQYPAGLGPTHEAITPFIPASAQRFEKTCFSACGAGGFFDALVRLQRTQVVLIGMEAHVCVLQTAAELAEKGLDVFVVEDAVCSRTHANRGNGLARMRDAGMAVSNTESVLFEWLRNARHEHFKSLSALIK